MNGVYATMRRILVKNIATEMDKTFGTGKFTTLSNPVSRAM
jgi:hypothetical protein